jgi:hypothetical protein
VRRLSIVAFVSLTVAQLAGCSSCMREEEQKPADTNPANTTVREKQPSLSGKYRFQIHGDASTD